MAPAAIWQILLFVYRIELLFGLESVALFRNCTIAEQKSLDYRAYTALTMRVLSEGTPGSHRNVMRGLDSDYTPPPTSACLRNCTVARGRRYTMDALIRIELEQAPIILANAIVSIRDLTGSS